MPIKPENRHFYRGAAWQALRAMILIREEQRCKLCRVANRIQIARGLGSDAGTYMECDGGAVFSDRDGTPLGWARGSEYNAAKFPMVVLTIGPCKGTRVHKAAPTKKDKWAYRTDYANDCDCKCFRLLHTNANCPGIIQLGSLRVHWPLARRWRWHHFETLIKLMYQQQNGKGYEYIGDVNWMSVQYESTTLIEIEALLGELKQEPWWLEAIRVPEAQQFVRRRIAAMIAVVAVQGRPSSLTHARAMFAEAMDGKPKPKQVELLKVEHSAPPRPVPVAAPVAVVAAVLERREQLSLF